MIPHGQSSFLQRITYLGWIQVFVAIVVIVRLFVLQVLYSDEYKTLAEENRTRVRVTFAPRGFILDRWGDPLVKNIKSYNALIVPQESGDLPKALNLIAPLLNLNETEKKAILKKAKMQPKFIPLSLKTNLTWDQVSTLELHNTELPGIYTEEGRARDYLLNQYASHLIGYISSPNRQQAEENKLLLMPGAKIGKNGIEGYYEDDIRGETGQRSVEVNARGRIIRELKNTIPKAGNNFYLTIDKDLQSYIGKLLEPYKSAAAVVLDIHTGEVLAMVSSPGYDPSLFFNGIAHEPWKQLINSPYAPMINKVISGQYSPGSAFKIVIALAILDAGINPNETVFCPGFMMLGKHKFHCWQHHGHGSVNLSQAIAQSCDVYFYNMIRRLKIENVLKISKKLGVHQKTDIDLDGEKEGFIASPEWKKRVKKEPWYPGDSILTSIGQGYILMTPLQMVTMVAQIANGGYKLHPYVKLRKEHDKDQSKKSLGLNADHLRFVLNSLSDVVNDPKGTSYKARIIEEKYKMGGKTSTAQVRRISMQERLSGVREGGALPWHLRDTAEFVGFAPVDNPRYAVAVIGEHEGWGSVFGAPKGRDILYNTQKIMEQKEERLKEEPSHVQ